LSEHRERAFLPALFKFLAGLVLALLGLMALFVMYPQPFFSYRHQDEFLDLHSTEPLPMALVSTLQRAAAHRSTPNGSEPRRLRVFLCNHYGLYSLFCPTSSREFGCRSLLTDNIFLARVDSAGKLALRNRPQANQAPLEAVLDRALAGQE